MVADQMIFQSEKTLGEIGDKVDASEKAELQAKIDALKEALKGSDIEGYQGKTGRTPRKSSTPVSEKTLSAGSSSHSRQIPVQQPQYDRRLE